MQRATLPTADLVVLLAYVTGIALFGCWFLRTSRTSRDFMIAGLGLPGWAVGLSIFATFLSSNTFLGVPGKAYATNWNAFVFSLSLPVAAWIAVRYFVPFYRRCGEVSAYAHLEKRFGEWARMYAIICYLLTQLARMGAILFGTALALQALLGWRMQTIILTIGIVATLYTVLGGIRAVIWTDVVQAVVLIFGAVIILLMVLLGMPGGPCEVLAIASQHGKLGLGDFSTSIRASTFWVVLFYGLFVNLTNFGIDQNYVQRYHTANSDRAAARSVWLGALLYVPISMAFFLLGTSLFSYYRTNEAAMSDLKMRIAMEKPADPAVPLEARIAQLSDAEIGDRVLPHFMTTRLPRGLAGLVIAAILAAAMSSIDSSLNSSATVYLSDIHRRYVNPGVDERGAMRALHGFTAIWGAAGTAAALAMIGVQSVLDAWWKLSGIFAGGMLGLFLLGRLAPRAGGRAAGAGVLCGVGVIAWMTLSPGSRLPMSLQSPFHASWIIVVGTLTILLVGMLVSKAATRQH